MKNPTKSQITKWVTALRSGEYKQTTSCLQTEYGYCCLGVACKIFIQEHKLELDSNGIIDGFGPNQQPNSPEWLTLVNPKFHTKTGEYLASLNDVSKFTFDEIADMLELVYIHKILN